MNTSTMNYYDQPEVPVPTSDGFLSGTNEFMESNSAISNFAFIILVVVIFMIVMQIGINLIQYIFYPKTDVRLVRGMVDAQEEVEIKQDPRSNGAIPIYRSNDERGGIEFTYSVWMYVSDVNTDNNGEYAHVFHKGESNITSSEYNLGDEVINQGLNFPNNGPGVYLKRVSNSNTGNSNNTDEYDQAGVIVVMNTYPDETNAYQTNHIVEKVDISNIPLKNWVHLVLVVKGRNLDVYINGNIAKRHILTGVPKQNYGNIFVGRGFKGNISNLTYFNEAIGTRQIYNILRLGPDLRMTKNSNLMNKEFDYLSLDWFLGNSDNIAPDSTS